MGAGAVLLIGARSAGPHRSRGPGPTPVAVGGGDRPPLWWVTLPPSGAAKLMSLATAPLPCGIHLGGSYAGGPRCRTGPTLPCRSRSRPGGERASLHHVRITLAASRPTLFTSIPRAPSRSGSVADEWQSRPVPAKWSANRRARGSPLSPTFKSRDRLGLAACATRTPWVLSTFICGSGAAYFAAADLGQVPIQVEPPLRPPGDMARDQI